MKGRYHRHQRVSRQPRRNWHRPSQQLGVESALPVIISKPSLDPLTSRDTPNSSDTSKVNQASSASTPQKIHRYQCPGCSADLVFEPRDGCLSCSYCGRSEPIPTSAAEVQERSYEEYLKLRPEQLKPISPEALEVQCSGCGTTVSFTPPEVAGDCPFCAAKIVAQPQVAHPMLAPEGVLPFANCAAPGCRRHQGVARISLVRAQCIGETGKTRAGQQRLSPVLDL